MYFEWDKAKNAANIRKHGLDFSDVVDIFNHPMLTLLDDRETGSEPRWIAIGWVRDLIGVVVYCEREGEVIRVISARKATKQEVRRYVRKIRK